MNNFKSSYSISNILLLCIVVSVYSMSGVFTKIASAYVFLSVPYLLCLITVIGILGCYAVLWQAILKRVPLHQAYPFRSLSVILGLAIAYFVFHEEVTWQNLLGGGIVLLGLLIMTTGK